jgi:2-dehydropantoate 2-reductase
MKIAVVGCGAVGSYYGAKLCRAGETVHFMLRSDYDVVRRKGVFIRSRDGNFHVNPKCARAPEDIGVCDLVLIGLKATTNAQLPALLPPLAGPRTAVVTLQNGLGNEECVATVCGAERVLGGLCFVCLNRVEPGIIQHIDHGQIVLGEFQRWPEPRTHDIASLFRKAGVPCKVTDNLEKAHWEKLAWNVPFNGLGVASAAGYDAVASGRVAPDATLQPCLTTDQLLADGRWERLVRELMQEVIAAARGIRLKIADDLTEKHLERTRTMGAYRASTLIDFERGKPLELESLFLEPLRQAQRAGVKTPRLQALCAVLQELDARATRQAHE